MIAWSFSQVRGQGKLHAFLFHYLHFFSFFFLSWIVLLSVDSSYSNKMTKWAPRLDNNRNIETWKKYEMMAFSMMWDNYESVRNQLMHLYMYFRSNRRARVVTGRLITHVRYMQLRYNRLRIKFGTCVSLYRPCQHVCFRSSLFRFK